MNSRYHRMIYGVSSLCRATPWRIACSDYSDDALWVTRIYHRLCRLLPYPVDRKQCPHPNTDEKISRCESAGCLSLYVSGMIDPWICRSGLSSPYCGDSHAGDGGGVKIR